MVSQMIDMPKTLALLTREEGEKLKAYQCTAGKWTIGVGHNLEAHGYSAEDARHVVWTREESQATLRADVGSVVSDIITEWPWAISLDPARFAVLVSMGFQMGVLGLAKFKRTLAAIKAGRYEDAATYMLESAWAKQTPARAKRHAEQMRTGEWA